MSDVKLPIKTVREGNKITKVCVEDVYKMINRVQDAMNKAYDNSVDIINSIHKTYDNCEGELIVGKGISQPCLTDAFDETIGNNIAFMKAKLNANMKKRNLLAKVYNEYMKTLNTIEEEVLKIDSYIIMDITGIRKYNPEYLDYIKIENNEIQE